MYFWYESNGNKTTIDTKERVIKKYTDKSDFTEENGWNMSVIDEKLKDFLLKQGYVDLDLEIVKQNKKKC